MNEPELELMLPREAAAILRVHPQTVTRWARTGQIRSVTTIGGHRRFYSADIRAIVTKREAS